MGLFIRLAWRNLLRNRKRSTVTALGITLGIGFCITTLAIMDGLSNDLITGTTAGQVGHIQIHQKDYLAKRQLQQTIANNTELLQSVRQNSQITAAAARIYSFGYLSKDNKSVGVSLFGVEPDHEQRVTTLAEQMVSGTFLSTPTPWPLGQALNDEQKQLDEQLTAQAVADAFAELDGLFSDNSSTQQQTNQLIDTLAPLPDVPPKVILGVKLAKNLQADEGDIVTLLYETSLGAQQSLQLEVAGTSRQGTDLIDRTRIVFHLQDLQKLLQLPNQSHEIAIKTYDLATVVQVSDSVSEAISVHEQQLSVQTWSELRPDILALIQSNQALMGTLVFIIFLIAGVGVMNAMLVSVMERRKELCLLKALGLKGNNVVWLVTVETLMLTLVASIAGLIMGIALGSYLQHYGWDISQFGEFSLAGVGMTSALKAKLTLDNLLTPVVVMFIIALLAALYPALSAARLIPAQGMRSS
ncbi:hypothetical protein PCIT_b0258 [Pseudoalteromonas citrea]|uniref:ABC transporter permease n=2 Tax=Pseudoalteromonas citrea TaxID=43655 RepID=A0AAD4FPS4_9GAMM|nr:FtsX-like permease family protein [Pseudoalteromonas citrea]KAF7764297.1 hypothetical protein PCIT_b0258 [Pseudoalteromonas citrea]